MKTYILTETVFSARDRIRAGEIVTTMTTWVYANDSTAADIVTSDGRRVNEVSTRKLGALPKPGKVVLRAGEWL